MTRDEADDIAKRAADEAVKRAFLVIGVDMSDTASIIRMQANLQHLDKWKRSVDQVERVGWTTIVGILVSGILGALWLGIKVMLGK